MKVPDRTLRTDRQRGADWCNAQAGLDLRP
jgi:hypothetical protein